MVGEVFAGLSAFKSMLDTAKAIKDMNDAAVRNAAAVELTEKILATQAAQMALLVEVRDLKEKIAAFEKRETEKQRYEMKNLGNGATVYMLKPNARGTEPPHWVCAHCYQKGEIFILQLTVEGRNRANARRGWFCPSCHNEIEPPSNVVRWLS